jgi:hypothetical protein
MFKSSLISLSAPEDLQMDLTGFASLQRIAIPKLPTKLFNFPQSLLVLSLTKMTTFLKFLNFPSYNALNWETQIVFHLLLI